MNQFDQSESLPQNVGETERWVSVGAGAAMALIGISRFRIGALLATAAGVMLIKRGLTGHCALKQMIEQNQQQPQEPMESGQEQAAPATAGL